MRKKVSSPVEEPEVEEGEQDLDIPLLPLSPTNRFPNPNLPLALDTEGILTLSANDFVSKRTITLGESGSGKGNTGALLEEHLLQHGLPMTIVDLEGESWSLKEVCPTLLVVGRSAHADREYAPEQMGRLAELSVEQGFSVVLDFSGYEEEEYYALLVPYLHGLWAACDRRRTPYHLVLDEVHEFVPQVGMTPVKRQVIRIAKRGRKRGLGMIAMSQETASVDNQLLKQSGITVLLSVHYPADLDRYATLIPGMTRAVVEQTVPKFSQGKGLVIFKHVPHLVQILPRRTFDPSHTPQLGTAVEEPTVYEVDETTLQVLDEQLPPTMPLTPEPLDRAALIQLVRSLQQAGSAVQGASVQQNLLTLQTVLESKDHELALLREERNQLLTERGRVASGDTGVGTVVETEEEAPHMLPWPELVGRAQQLETEKQRLEDEVRRLWALIEKGAPHPEEQANHAQHGTGPSITNVHFEQANIETFHAGTGVAVRGEVVEQRERVQPSVAVTEIEPPQEERVLTGEALLQSLLRSERSSFIRLSAQIAALCASEKILLTWLLEHDGEAFSSLQLTDAVNLDIHAAWRGRTEKLAKLPFTRRWLNKKLWYQATFAAYSHKTFSSVESEVLRQELLRILSSS